MVGPEAKKEEAALRPLVSVVAAAGPTEMVGVGHTWLPLYHQPRTDEPLSAPFCPEDGENCT